MKKLLLTMVMSLATLGACAKEPHWSHKACVEEIEGRLNLTDYVYSVKEVENEYSHGDDEVYAFEITVRAEGREWQYYCYAVLDDGEVIYIDCDKWYGD